MQVYQYEIETDDYDITTVSYTLDYIEEADTPFGPIVRQEVTILEIEGKIDASLNNDDIIDLILETY